LIDFVGVSTRFVLIDFVGVIYYILRKEETIKITTLPIVFC